MTTDIIGLPPGTVIACDTGCWSLRIAMLDETIEPGHKWQVVATVRQTDRTILEGVSGDRAVGYGHTLAAAVGDAGLAWDLVHDDVLAALRGDE